MATTRAVTKQTAAKKTTKSGQVSKAAAKTTRTRRAAASKKKGVNPTATGRRATATGRRATATGRTNVSKKALMAKKKPAKRTTQTNLQGWISRFDPATGVGSVKVNADEYPLDLSQVPLLNKGYVQLKSGRKVSITVDSEKGFSGIHAL